VKCGKPVPKSVWIGGKKRNCQRRKYCLECSPFGEHNTSKLEEVRAEGQKKIKTCPVCGKEHCQTSRKCFACYFQEKQARRQKLVEELVGGFECKICGYNKTKTNIHFHHVNPETKLFGLSTREMMLSWEKVKEEIKKCLIVCSNCHGEIHAGLIAKEDINRLWKAY